MDRYTGFVARISSPEGRWIAAVALLVALGAVAWALIVQERGWKASQRLRIHRRRQRRSKPGAAPKRRARKEARATPRSGSEP